MPLPYIPETITVHLGSPDADAPNITVPFTDYIKNVASSEIYPTWPESALRANIYAIVTFALNRIYTEWYPSRGYDFDITNSTQFDQAFVRNRDYFENISEIVDEIFNDYVVRQGSVEPLFTQFCNGTTVTCEGLSQWGTVPLAEEGRSPYEILQYYYGDDIDIEKNAPVSADEDSWPGYTLKQGAAGRDVNILQQELNRIAQNYPAIPRITNARGVYDLETQRAVEKFQEIFSLPVTGEVDKATWYKIKRYFVGVKRLSELTSEGLTPSEAALDYPSQLSRGSRGEGVRTIQYYLNVIAYFNPSLNTLPMDGDFGSATENAVKEFQRFYGLPVTGVVDEPTWRMLEKVYFDILGGLSSGYQGRRAKLYPGYFLAQGETGQNVTDLQTYLAFVGENYSELPVIPITGYYGQQTQDAVYAFQRLFGLPLTGTVGPLTWYYLARQYDMLNEEMSE
ncbi:MAG: peptidoglycan-binding protein [Oscillospiraceae bacterium]|nr:peptidoglycan-binding protein [Oscillospiraceae bacterium]